MWFKNTRTAAWRSSQATRSAGRSSEQTSARRRIGGGGVSSKRLAETRRFRGGPTRIADGPTKNGDGARERSTTAAAAAAEPRAAAAEDASTTAASRKRAEEPAAVVAKRRAGESRCWAADARGDGEKQQRPLGQRPALSGEGEMATVTTAAT
ncbi:hypothetical protein Scep_022581 [Stephania cephalantha]|uniref:Uncharacterized protein n=1 Tax=Stephania cephalantha TaxID=152367 RepID=A0AAP0FBI8_9MAGN